MQPGLPEVGIHFGVVVCPETVTLVEQEIIVYYIL